MSAAAGPLAVLAAVRMAGPTDPDLRRNPPVVSSRRMREARRRAVQHSQISRAT